MVRRSIVVLIVAAIGLAACGQSAIERERSASLTATVQTFRAASTVRAANRTPTPTERVWTVTVHPTSTPTMTPTLTPIQPTWIASPEGRQCDESGCWYERDDDYNPTYEAMAAEELTAEAEADYAQEEPADDGDYVGDEPEVDGGSGSDFFNCDAAYPDFCIPPVWMYGDLDCVDIEGSYFTVYDPDPHWFDDDFDGIGCEWP